MNKAKTILLDEIRKTRYKAKQKLEESTRLSKVADELQEQADKL